MMKMRIIMFIFDDENDDNYIIMIMRVMMFIYGDNESGDDVLCDCIRVVHFRGRVALIY